jgi:hypothetical protein
MGAPWTEDEIEIIRKYHTVESDTELMHRLPGRTLQAIGWRRSHLGMLKNNSNNPLKTIREDQRRLQNRIGG